MNPRPTSGAASLATWSSVSSPRRALGIELLLLVAAGVVAALLHEAFRWPFKLPGHHGLEWLAILVGARLLSARRGAAFAVACGAAVAAVAAGAGVLRPSTYLLQGLALDALYLMLGRRSAMLLVLVVIGAVVHMISPLLKQIVSQGGWWTFGSLSQGLLYPLWTHALFGAVGAASGALAIKAWQRWRSHEPPR